jgi:hypothetical protein
MRSYVYAMLISVTLLASSCARFGGRPDQQVVSDVQNKINADSAFPDKQLTVSATQGVVTLSGNVSSDAARAAAANDAAHVDGVKTVVNNLVVVPPVISADSQPEPQSQPQSDAQAGSHPQPARSAAKPSPRTGWHKFGDAAPGSKSQNAKANDSGSPAPAPAPSPSSVPVPATTAAAQLPAPVAPPVPITVPSGTQLSISLTSELNSETAQVGDTFRASVARPVVVGGVTVISTTADVEGRVVDVKSAGRFAGKSDLVIELTRLHMDGKSYSLTTDRWSKSGSSRGKSTATKVGAGAAVGAILGGIFGGGKGAAIGGAAGAGAGTGVAAAGKAQQIILRPETRLDFQLENSISVVPGVKSQPLSSTPQGN